VRLSKVEEALAGQQATADAIDKAVKDAAEGIEPINSDIHASEEYRRAMIAVFAKRAILKAASRA
jgi:carbon-monoxide dehydrogenase medium subunit